MGLLEKRTLKEFQEGNYLKLIKEINTIAGYEIVFDVKWDTIALEGSSSLYNEGFTNVYFIPIINALKEITSDTLGKEALKNTLKKIVIKNENGIYYPDRAYTFDIDTLTIDHEPGTNISEDYIPGRSDSLCKLLMSKL